MISVIIPTYKKKEQLIRNLAHNLPFFKECEIIVVNDNPAESIVEDIKQFESVVLIENKKNLGFSGAVNCGVKKAKGEFLFLLNNDVLLHNDGFISLLDRFAKHPNLFAIALSQRDKDGALGGKNRILWKSGMILHERSPATSTGVTAWAEGGSSIFRSSLFRELGMLDELYSPFYWEDVDLSYRAWKAGYEVLFSSEVAVTHHHESTIGAFYHTHKIKEISYRNQFIFNWKNLTDTELLIKHLLSLPLLVVFAVLGADSALLAGIVKAFLKLPAIFKERQKLKKINKRTDQQILDMF